ncbi:calcium/calmodulin-dependent 3',5'-cyclic nucleotide phosphodiesterase 1A-like [Sinocyclocheilus grahami]|uniref:calcium/calmodulin-dependent 3',5'-cyclic nucleotide phosphodiesterase 1A-like n=1 Tax=Sinocyclocheilus grahami TaxID=75366 RepID=UPI0007AD1AB4|nr:PREDICTED: calcium/calmodulin-dependent 3',5'-cyclic nucleotide phosphodiesterase 1A-like [Sinocyclocheilus grahami]
MEPLLLISLIAADVPPQLVVLLKFTPQNDEKSEVAILYNDRSVLENHHVSAAYRLMQEDEMNILVNLSKDDWRELRTLVIEMVMSTDMSCHFQQIKTMRNALQQPEGIDKAKALSLMLHAADISHPAKGWKLHYRWTQALMEEFFRQVHSS